MVERVPPSNFSSSWSRVDQSTDPSFFSDVLQATRAQLLEQARREPAQVFGPLELRAGLRVLDVGCGTGEYVRVMAPLVAPGGVVGIDLSAALIDRARQLSGDAGPNLSFRVGDAYELPFPDGSFDRVICTQVLLHLADPWRAVQEMRRILAPGGRLSIGEWDWDSTCLGVTDRELGRRFVHLLCDQMYNGLIVRELDWRLQSQGFARVELSPQVRLTRDLDAAFHWLIAPAAAELVRRGALTSAEGDRLLEDLRDRGRTGRYFLARTYYSITATTHS